MRLREGNPLGVPFFYGHFSCGFFITEIHEGKPQRFVSKPNSFWKPVRWGVKNIYPSINYFVPKTSMQNKCSNGSVVSR